MWIKKSTDIYILSYQPNWQDDKISDNLNNLDKEIISIIKDNKYSTIPEIARITNKSEPTIHRHLDTLVKQGKVVRIESRKNGYWEIN